MSFLQGLSLLLIALKLLGHWDHSWWWIAGLLFLGGIIEDEADKIRKKGGQP